MTFSTRRSRSAARCSTFSLASSDADARPMPNPRSSGAPLITSFLRLRRGRPFSDAKKDCARGVGTRKLGDGVLGEGSGSVGCGGGEFGVAGRSGIWSGSDTRGGEGGGESCGRNGFAANTGSSSNMHEGALVPNGSISGRGECAVGSIGVASVEAVEPPEELDDDTDGASARGGRTDIEKDGREGVCIVSRELERRMSRTSEEPRGVLGGGEGFPPEPARGRPDIKLRSLSRFVALLAGDADGISAGTCLMRGRDATESSDQRDASAASASSSSAGLSKDEQVMASPGETTSDSALAAASLISDGSRVGAGASEGDGIVASSARLRNWGVECDVVSVGSVGRCLRLGLELIV